MKDGKSFDYSIFWSDNAKADLKRIYEFNKEAFSMEFAEKIREEIYESVGRIVFLEQWQQDEILEEHYRRVIIRHYKIVYCIIEKHTIHILMIFDVRQNPSKYQLKVD